MSRFELFQHIVDPKEDDPYEWMVEENDGIHIQRWFETREKAEEWIAEVNAADTHGTGAA